MLFHYGCTQSLFLQNSCHLCWYWAKIWCGISLVTAKSGKHCPNFLSIFFSGGFYNFSVISIKLKCPKDCILVTLTVQNNVQSHLVLTLTWPCWFQKAAGTSEARSPPGELVESAGRSASARSRGHLETRAKAEQKLITTSAQLCWWKL